MPQVLSVYEAQYVHHGMKSAYLINASQPNARDMIKTARRYAGETDYKYLSDITVCSDIRRLRMFPNILMLLSSHLGCFIIQA